MPNAEQHRVQGEIVVGEEVVGDDEVLRGGRLGRAQLGPGLEDAVQIDLRVHITLMKTRMLCHIHDVRTYMGSSREGRHDRLDRIRLCVYIDIMVMKPEYGVTHVGGVRSVRKYRRRGVHPSEVLDVAYGSE